MLAPSFLRDNWVKAHFPEGTVESKLVKRSSFCSKQSRAWAFWSINWAQCPATDTGLFLGLFFFFFAFSLLNPEDLVSFHAGVRDYDSCKKKNNEMAKHDRMYINV